MLIALFADIHANRQAFEACLAHAREQQVDRYAFLGDYVGYGADPEWVVEKGGEFVNQGAIAIVGNHDRAVSDPTLPMNRNAQIAIEWTRNQLGVSARELLDRLPMTVEEGGRLYAHGDASAPSRFVYVVDSDVARHSIESTRAPVTIVGHVHMPAIYSLAQTGKLTLFQPGPGVSIPVLRQRRWLMVLGSVGQPRDGNPAASYSIFNTDTSEVTFLRVPYDIETAAARIREAGLPAPLAERLSRGR
jgi:diadenosine tetraphosphatase ApaH/serine/threonine PP2A family protein phosphatase